MSIYPKTPVILKLAPLVQGSTFRGIKSLRTLFDNMELAGDLVAMRLRWKEYLAAPVTLEQSIENEEIELLDASEWKVHVKPFETAGWKPGEWVADVECTDTNQRIDKWVRLVLPIVP